MGFVSNAVKHVFKGSSGGGGAVRPYQNEQLKAITARQLLTESLAKRPDEPELGAKKKKKKGRKSLFIGRQNKDSQKSQSGVGINL